MISKTQQIIEKITPTVRKYIIYDKLVFIESDKFVLDDFPKTLYLTFGATIIGDSGLMQRVIYEVGSGTVEFSLHMVNINY